MFERDDIAVVLRNATNDFIPDGQDCVEYLCDQMRSLKVLRDDENQLVRVYKEDKDGNVIEKEKKEMIVGDFLDHVGKSNKGEGGSEIHVSWVSTSRGADLLH